LAVKKMTPLNAIPVTDVLILHRSGGRPPGLPEGFEFYWGGYQLRHQPGGYTDGMSSPQFTHVLSAAEPYGWALPAAVAHDGGYHDDLEKWTVDGWKKITLTKAECDQMFYDLLLLLAAGNLPQQSLAKLFYEAVHLGGQAAFNEGRARAAERAAGQPEPIATAP
jgi:hypothetical protein